MLIDAPRVPCAASVIRTFRALQPSGTGLLGVRSEDQRFLTLRHRVGRVDVAVLPTPLEDSEAQMVVMLDCIEPHPLLFAHIVAAVAEASDAIAVDFALHDCAFDRTSGDGLDDGRLM